MRAPRSLTLTQLLHRHAPIPTAGKKKILLARLTRAAIHDKLFATDWVERIRAQARKNGFVVTDIEDKTARSYGEALYQEHFCDQQNRFRSQRKEEKKAKRA
jgi:hypothetical protein